MMTIQSALHFSLNFEGVSLWKGIVGWREEDNTTIRRIVDITRESSSNENY